MKKLLCMALPMAALIFAGPGRAIAQDASADDIEAMYSAEEEKTATTPRSAERERVTTPAQTDVKDLSDLAKLAPFDDVAVIQKRYLPKTQRFELFAGATGVINDAFFMNVGGVGRLGYYFLERWGIEAMAFLLSSSEKDTTSGLKERGVETKSLLTTESYYGLDLKWTPAYGKMTFGNKAITPFDLYFSLGGGVTGLADGGTAPTLHLGTGQVFAYSKSVAFRWDFSWNFFNAESKVTGESSLHNNLFLTVGASLFFPEATYR